MPTSTGYLNQFENNGVYYDLHDTDLRSKIGQANGIAELDANGKVPSGQLPSYVDEVTDAYYADGEMYIVPTYEGYLYEGDFYKDEDHTELITPEADTYYFDKTGEKYYQYSALAYIEVSPPTPITPASDKIYVNIAVNPAEIYRWTGSTYAKVSSGDGGLVLGETSQTAYRGDRGKTAYDHSQDSGRITTAVSSGLYKVAATAQGHVAGLTAVEKSDITALGIPESDTTYNVVNTTAAGLAPQLPNEATTTKYLRQDATWEVPPDGKVVQTVTTVNSNYEVLFSQTADNTTRTEGARKSSHFIANPSSGLLAVTQGKAKVNKSMLTGTGTAAEDKGSGVSPRYFPAKWTFNTGLTVADGDMFTIKLPVAGHSYGEYISVDNGTNYYPVGYNTNSLLTTHFPVGAIITVVFKSDGVINSIYPVTGGDAKVNVDGGAFYVQNLYDSGNSNTYDRNRYNAAIKAWGTALVAGNVIVAGTGTNAGLYMHLKQNAAFDITYPILYLNEAVAASGTTTNTYDILNIATATTQTGTWTAYKPVFIKGQLSGTTFTPVSATPLTQTIPTTADGYEYILLGIATATTTVYLQERHPIYAYRNGVFGEIVPASDYADNAGTVNGKTVGVNVPSTAVFTDTVGCAYCATAAATAAKTATCTGYSLLNKSYLVVTIVTANTSKTALTLNVNGKGAKSIYINGTASSTSNYTLPAGTYLVYYDSNKYYFRTDGKITGDITGDAATVGGVTVPSDAEFTDYKLWQVGDNSSSSAFRVLLSGSSNDTDETNAARKSGGLVYKPNYKSFGQGLNVDATGNGAHAEGSSSCASGLSCHAEGSYTTAKASGACHAEGYYSYASGLYSHAEGHHTTSSGDNSHSEGYYTTASNFGSKTLGHYNATMGTGGKWNNTSGTVLAIGNGIHSTAPRNAFSVQYSGVVKAASTITASTTADYAEYFEWADENPNNEDRVGYFVTFDSDNKIRIATFEDDYILGVSSGEPFVLGNGDCDVWNGMVLRDEFRRVIYEPAPDYIHVNGGDKIPNLDENGNQIYYGTRPKINPNYDPSIPYISRADRPEWCPVGMLGVLAVRDDGTCEVNGYAVVNESGIATKYIGQNQNKYRVIHRNGQNVVEIVFR